MYCGSCGKQIDDDSRFCPFCGATIDNSTQNAASDSIPSFTAPDADVPQFTAPGSADGNKTVANGDASIPQFKAPSDDIPTFKAPGNDILHLQHLKGKELRATSVTTMKMSRP